MNAPSLSRALVVEDEPATRARLRAIVGRAFPGVVVAEAHDVASGRAALASGNFELLLVDLRFPDGTGIDLLRSAREASATLLAVVATVLDDDEHLFSAFAAGADGYLLKEQPEEQLLGHLRALRSGVPALSPSMARRMLAYFRRTPVDVLLPTAGGRVEAPQLLSPRETEVLSLIGRGLRGGEVAQLLSLTENTVSSYVKDIYRKLNISSRAEAALEARRRGLV